MSFTLSAGKRQIDLSVPVCMGVINVTPDSFSDGAELQRVGADDFRVDTDKALRRAEAQVAEGAVFVDIGGESTRPGASQVTPEMELERVIPVVEAIQANLDVCISVDTSSPMVMKEAIASGAELINDIRALAMPGAIEAAVNSNAAVSLMHMQGQPGTMQQAVYYDDVTREVEEFLQQRVAACLAAGIERQRLLVDPGFGFGKTVEHNYRLLKDLAGFESLELPVLIGVSRKSMIGAATGRPVAQRLPGSVAATVLALQGGARVIRSHDVAATIDAIQVYCAYCNA